MIDTKNNNIEAKYNEDNIDRNIDKISDKKHCELCGSLIVEENKIKQHKDVDVILKIAQEYCLNPVGMRVLFCTIAYPHKTLREYGEMLNLSRKSIGHNIKIMERKLGKIYCPKMGNRIPCENKTNKIDGRKKYW